MIETLKLLLPALIPSWRFFDVIAPSPRIEFAAVGNAQDAALNWHEFRPRPQMLSLSAMLGRLFWNSDWNETLFLVSCAEQIMENPTEHSINEIVTRIRAGLDRCGVHEVLYLQFRLVFVRRECERLQKDITFTSRIYSP